MEADTESKAKAAGHAIHQQLVAFPLGLLTIAVVFDVIGLLAKNGHFTSAGYLMIAAGVIMGLLAAVFGLIDYVAVPHGARAKRVGRVHGMGNAVMMVLFAMSWFLRGGIQDFTPTPPWPSCWSCWPLSSPAAPGGWVEEKRKRWPGPLPR